MVLTKVLTYDAKTKKSKVVERDIELSPQNPKLKGLNLKKLKNVLKAKGIITSDSDIE